MDDFKVIRYSKEHKDSWDKFVDEAKNATFLFKRDFMEYHNDRFEDFSLLVYKKNKLVALLPANKENDIVCSHRGLTYGGIILDKKNKYLIIENILEILIHFLQNNYIKEFQIKLIPNFYCKTSSEEVNYFLHNMGGQLFNKNMTLAINLNSFQISNNKLKKFRNISKTEIYFKQEQTFNNFWNHVLIPRLIEKHNTYPVHNLNEINKLADIFPNNIKQFSVFDGQEIIAGITLFIFENGVKSQYGATTKKGEKLRALDFLYIHLIEKFKNEGKLFFDMGTVNIDDTYNIGLLNQKQELGCSVYNQDFYKLSLT